MDDLSGWEIIRPNVGAESAPRNYPAIDRTKGAGAGARTAAADTYGFKQEMLGGWGDEFGAGVMAVSDWLYGKTAGDGSAPLGDLYGEYVGIERDKQAAYRKDNKVASVGANVLGGLALGPGKAAAATFGGRVAQGVKAGAVAGGVAGAGEGSGLNRLDTAATGAAIGGAVGAALPALGRGLSIGQRGYAYVRGLKGEGAKAQARKLLIDALRKDGLAPADINGIVNSGKPFVIADMGPNTQALVASAGRHAGTGREGLQTFMEGRTAGQFGRISDDLSRTMGANGADFAGTAADVAARRGAAAKAGYPAAYAKDGPALSAGAKEILDRPSGKAAVSAARRVMADKGKPVTDASGKYTVEMLDQIQRAMRDRAAKMSGDRAAEMSGTVKDLRAALIRELPADLRKVMDDYRAESELIDAMNSGFKFLRGEGDDVATAMAKMSPAEADMFRLGVARALRTKMGAKVDGGDISSMFANENMRERLRVVFKDEFALQEFLQSVKTEKVMQETRNALLKGSQTAGRGVDDQAFRGGALGEAATDAAVDAGSVGLVRAALNAGGRAAGHAKERVLDGVSEAVGDEVVRLAATPPGAGLAADILRRPAAASLPATRAGRAMVRADSGASQGIAPASVTLGAAGGAAFAPDRAPPPLPSGDWVIIRPR